MLVEPMSRSGGGSVRRGGGSVTDSSGTGSSAWSAPNPSVARTAAARPSAGIAASAYPHPHQLRARSTARTLSAGRNGPERVTCVPKRTTRRGRGGWGGGRRLARRVTGWPGQEPEGGRRDVRRRREPLRPDEHVAVGRAGPSLAASDQACAAPEARGAGARRCGRNRGVHGRTGALGRVVCRGRLLAGHAAGGGRAERAEGGGGRAAVAVRRRGVRRRDDRVRAPQPGRPRGGAARDGKGDPARGPDRSVRVLHAIVAAGA